MTEQAQSIAPILHQLAQYFSQQGPLGIAVSGGVDSMTLAYVANRYNSDVVLYHAVSAAVPADATQRVERYARLHDWSLYLVDAGELSNPEYRANPVDRCFHCKSCLYQSIQQQTQRQLLSGANMDDLEDYRPGLLAADVFNVKHPFVEFNVCKRQIRAIARFFDLDELAELPASPCLASRIESHVPIADSLLSVVEQAEQVVRSQIPARVVRCRIRRKDVVVELDDMALASLSLSRKARIRRQMQTILDAAAINKPVAFALYQRGSAFVIPPEQVSYA